MAKIELPFRKQFGKRIYTYFEGYRSKERALKMAALWRKKELGARVVHDGAGIYVVYVLYDD